jgi:D,D-heptose 1,7-bisphosphate phosphatase
MKEKKIDLVIFAGGKGSRIAKYTRSTPKPLIKIHNINFIQYLLNFYSKFDFNKIYILAGYKAIKFQKFHNKLVNLIPVEVIKEKKKLDTGGALCQLKKKISHQFILINGDSFVDYDFNKFVNNKLKKNKIGKILLIKNYTYKKNKKLSNLSIDKNQILKKDGDLMNAGIYLFKKKIFKYLKLQKISLEDEILPLLIEKKLIQGSFTSNNALDIGTYKNLKKAKFFLKKYINIPSVFLDRDGVINVDKKYVCKIKDFHLRRNVIGGLKFLSKKKINIFIVTNQAGIAKGLFTEKKFLNFSRYMKKQFIKKNIYINDIEYCPFHKKGVILKYKKNSNYRKPGNLMLEKLIKKWGISKKNSYMIGDQISDYKAAKKSKIYFEFAKANFFEQVKKINKKKVFNNY